MLVVRLILMTVVLGSGGGAALAQEPGDDWLRSGPGDEVVVDLPEGGVELESLVVAVSRRIGTTFVFADDGLRTERIVQIGARRLPAGRLLAHLKLLLSASSLVLAPVDPGRTDVMRILRLAPGAGGRSRIVFASPGELAGLRRREGEWVTTTFRLRHIGAGEARGALAPIAAGARRAVITALTESRSLVVTAYAPTVWLIHRVLQILDTDIDPAQMRFTTLPLENHDADDLAASLAQLVEAREPGPTTPRIVGDRLTNSLVVYAVEADLVGLVGVVAALDEQAADPESTIRVHSLKNTEAEEVETVLRDFFGLETRSRERAGSETSESRRRREDRRDGGSAEASTGGDRSPARADPQQRTPRSRTAADGDEHIRIVADPSSNSLLVSANEFRQREISRLIEQLDRRRAQVYVQVVLADLTSAELERLGVELAGMEGDFFGLTGFGLSEVTSPSGGSATLLSRLPDLAARGLTGGFLGPLSGVSLLVHLFEQTLETKLYTVASLLVDESQEGTLVVGTQVPTTSTTESIARGDLGQSDTPFDRTLIRSTTEFDSYNDASFTFVVRPHVARGEAIRVELDVTSQSFTGAQSDPQLPPPRSNQGFSSEVTLPSGRTAFLGGLGIDRESTTVQGVPFLSDLPLIGSLFTTTSTEHEQRHLYAFITATTISRGEILERITEERRRDAGVPAERPGGR